MRHLCYHMRDTSVPIRETPPLLNQHRTAKQTARARSPPSNSNTSRNRGVASPAAGPPRRSALPNRRVSLMVARVIATRVETEVSHHRQPGHHGALPIEIGGRGRPPHHRFRRQPPNPPPRRRARLWRSSRKNNILRCGSAMVSFNGVRCGRGFRIVFAGCRTGFARACGGGGLTAGKASVVRFAVSACSASRD